MDTKTATEIWARSPYELKFDMGYYDLSIDYDGGPEIATGEPKRITVRIANKLGIYGQHFSLNWRLPEGWQASPDRRADCYLAHPIEHTFTITPGEVAGGFSHVELEIRDFARSCPSVVVAPFQKRGTVQYSQPPVR